MINLQLPSEVPDGADVSWEARVPLNLSYSTFEEMSAFATHTAEAAKANPIIVVSDVISWNGQKIVRDRIQWTIYVKIGPTPPDPGPTPDPTPPPRPEGFAGEVFDLAIQINQPAKALQYAGNMDSLVSKIGAGALRDIPSIQAELARINGTVSPDPAWAPFTTFVNTKARERRITTVEQFKAFAAELAIGLHAASGARR